MGALRNVFNYSTLSEIFTKEISDGNKSEDGNDYIPKNII
jgi:hypothetical protein